MFLEINILQRWPSLVACAWRSVSMQTTHHISTAARQQYTCAGLYTPTTAPLHYPPDCVWQTCLCCSLPFPRVQQRQLASNHLWVMKEQEDMAYPRQTGCWLFPYPWQLKVVNTWHLAFWHSYLCNTRILVWSDTLGCIGGLGQD